MTDKEFSRLYGLTRSNYERIAFSYVCDKEDARDIVTDCFLYLWEHRDEVKDDNISVRKVTSEISGIAPAGSAAYLSKSIITFIVDALFPSMYLYASSYCSNAKRFEISGSRFTIPLLT